jgi:nicotinate phosphoribosyltransferase
MTQPASAEPEAPLVVDFYELTMAQSYLAEGLAGKSATFEVTCRTLPAGWGYLLAAGVTGLLEALEHFRFDAATLAFLASTGRFTPEFLETLATFRFRGDVRGLAEGTVFFADEPLLEVSGTIFESQLIETAVLNGLHFATLVCSKAARCVDAAAGRALVDFGLRRTHGADAGLAAARGSYLAGFTSTSNVAAGARYGIPVSGTMAHSYVEAFPDEPAAFAAFTRAYPEGTTLLIDTYDTLEGARRAIETAQALAARGGRLGGVRLDSGDLPSLSREVRALLDSGGCGGVEIVASGNLDEYAIAALLAAEAPIDGFGVGTRLGVSADAPSLDIAYKLVCFDDRPVMKLSHGKRTLPGAKQVWRRVVEGRFAGDLVALRDEDAPDSSIALLEPLMRGGIATSTQTLLEARGRAAAERQALDERHRVLAAERYPVAFSGRLGALGERLEAGLRAV